MHLPKPLYIITLLIIGLLLVGSLDVGAQDKAKAEAMPKKALKMFEQGNNKYLLRSLDEAMLVFEKTVKKYPRYAAAQMRLAEIYWELKKYDKASATYKQLLKIQPNSLNRFQTNMNLARLQYDQQHYDKALAQADSALAISLPTALDSHRKAAMRFKEQCQFIQYAKAHPVAFNPVHLDSTINTHRDEYLPMLTADEGIMVFTRRLTAALTANEDFYMAQNKGSDTAFLWQIATPLASPINTENNEGAICISPDGKKMFFAAKDRNDTEGGFDLYYCIKAGSEWVGPYNLGRPINTPAWESQPCISADGKSLYFASRRKGGLGGIDIWVTHLSEDRYWGEPQNLGNLINSEKDEQTPFIHPDNQTLYFSSNGHIGMGDADIYVSRRDTAGNWQKPQNLGYPINTEGNESGLTVTANGKRAYFAAKNDSMGIDIYYFDLPPQLKPRYVSYVKGRVFDADKPRIFLSASVELIDLDSGDTVLKTVTDEKNGEFLLTLPAGKNYMYNVAKQGYLFYSENFALKDTFAQKPYYLDIPLKPIVRDTATLSAQKAINNNALKKGQSVILKNVFFTTDSYDLQATSYTELNRLAQLLKENTQLNIEIGGHTDSTGTVAHNTELSSKRAKAVYDYIISKGIDKKRISYKGYGSTRPIANNKTPQGRATNRRTEFTIRE
jgi:outer membrane protein OmpA-like peptidoglycan-associated protein/tetratricopeptide (TPR) repeat protein